jgi:Replication-relaxation
MTRKQPHNKLNAKQLHTLTLLYKFRFATSALLAQYKHVSNQALHQSLSTLVKQGYVGKRFKKEYLLAGKAARYYLTPEGSAQIKGQPGIDPLVLHAQYKSPTASETFMNRCIDAMALYLQLQAVYPKAFNIYTKFETTRVTGFPKESPDLYLERVDVNEANPYYFFELQNGSQLFIVKKRIDAFIEHYEEDEWNKKVFPVILLVCDSPESEHAIQQHLAKILESTGIDDEITILTTSLRAAKSSIAKIWTNPLEPEKLYSLI